ncbi:Hypothetical protein D9617_5g067740 [Elsinoe fawcettii]|nr:Hypothetical protein D9617_5g067740 [Elsinoe fawcettii]
MLDVLERQRQAGMQLWTTLPELAMVPLLYNKFELSGRLPSPVPALLEVVKVFGKVIVERTKELAAGPFSRQKAVTMSSHSKKRSSTKIKKGKILVRSLLQSLREVGWHPVLIPNIDLFEHTGLACIRLSDCDLNEEGKDVGTVDLIRRFKEEPHNVRSLGLLKEVYRAVQEGTRATAASWREEYSRVVPSAQFLEDLGDRDHSSPGATTHHGVPYSDVLHQLVHDIHDELCGESPNTGVHYVWLSGYAMRIFEMIEERLEAAHDPIWRAAYCEDRMYAKDKRQRLCHLACSDNVHGTETAKIIAGVFRDTNDDHQATFWGEKSKSSTGYQERQVAGGNSMYISSCSGDGESKCGDVLRPCDQMDG